MRASDDHDNPRPSGDATADVAVIGAGAAGLFAGIWAGRELARRRAEAGHAGVAGGAGPGTASGAGPRVVALDGAKKLGAKILVAGGGRCNVTHHAVDARAYAGSSRNAIKKVLARFSIDDTRSFFSELGVELKREDTGKLFPTTDSARHVLDALLAAARQAGCSVRHPWRVESVRSIGDDANPLFEITEAAANAPDEQPRSLLARRVVVCTGGMSLPKTGSDGHGYSIVRKLGHTTTGRIFPSLVPLKLDQNASKLHELSGVACPVEIETRTGTGKRVARFENAMLCTHFGVSGPAALDVSRYYLETAHADAGASLIVNWLPGETFEGTDTMLQTLGPRTVLAALRERLPERLARMLCEHAGVDPSVKGAELRKDARRALAHTLTGFPLSVTGDRGFLFAEVTAGGVPLSELDLKTMESRTCPGLHLAGEICDVDGRIGGFNFQWAWASGHVAGTAAAAGAWNAPGCPSPL